MSTDQDIGARTEELAADAGPVERGVRPTHWMDDRRLYVSDRWLKSDEATSDYRAAYTVPAKMTRAGIRPLYPCGPCKGAGRAVDGDACGACGGSGGLAGPNFNSTAT